MQERDAAEWFLRLREGELADAERAQFAIWLAEAPNNVRAYLATAETWGVLQAVAWPTDSKVHLLGMLRQGAKANVISLSPAEECQHSIEKFPRAFPAKNRRRWYLANAVAGAALVSLAWYSIETRTPIYTTGRGEQRSIVLADGSVVQLNTLSTITVHFDSSGRRVDLRQGEAFFRVAHDSKRPFDVQTRFAVVRAVGTAFDVYSRPDSISITVVEGRVMVDSTIRKTDPATEAAPSQENIRPSAAIRAFKGITKCPAIPVAAGQQITFSPGLESVPVPAAANDAAAWIRRRIVLDNDRVDVAISEFNRYHTAQMQVHGTLASLRISGVFDVDDPNAFVRYLKEVQGGNPRLNDGTLILEK